MTVTLFLCSILEDHYQRKEESKIGACFESAIAHCRSLDRLHTCKTKYGSEDEIEEAVSEIAEGTNAVAELSCLECARADVILDERVTEVSAAFKLVRSANSIHACRESQMHPSYLLLQQTL